MICVKILVLKIRTVSCRMWSYDGLSIMEKRLIKEELKRTVTTVDSKIRVKETRDKPKFLIKNASVKLKHFNKQIN